MLDGTEVVEPNVQDLKSGITPVLKITDFKDKDGNLIQGAENVNMFVREGLQNKVEIVNKADNSVVNAKFVDGKFLLPVGNYSITLKEVPTFYNEVNPKTIEFSVEDNSFKEVVFSTTVKPVSSEAKQRVLHPFLVVAAQRRFRIIGRALVIVDGVRAAVFLARCG